VWRSRPWLGLNASSPLSRGGGVLRHRLRATAFLGFFQARQVERTVDKRDVCERLREIAHEPARARIVFLAQQSDVISQFEQPSE
jgi:hypothetical protein